MAAQPNRLLQMEEGISCAVCLMHFEDPRILPCQHSYCLKCLEKMVKKTDFDPENPLGGDEISCPRCRRVVSLGDKGVDGLPRNVDLNYAVEALKPILTPSPAAEPQESVPQYPPCTNHRKPLEYFCRLSSCNKPICGDCHVQSHQKHDVCKLEDAVNDGMEALRVKVLDKAEAMLHNVTVGIMDVERTIEVLNRRKDEMSTEIHAKFQRAFELLHAREQQMVSLTEKAVTEKVNNLRNQLELLHQVRKELDLHLNNLKAAISTPHGVLFLDQNNSSITENVSKAVQKGMSRERKPCENPDDGPHYYISDSFEQIVQEVGSVYCKPIPSKFIAQGDSLSKGFVGREGRFTVRAYDQFGQRSYVKGTTLKVLIDGPDGPINPTVAEEGVAGSPIDQYVVTFVPCSVGIYTVAITVNNVPITPSTFRSVVFKSRDYLLINSPSSVITKSMLGSNVANIRSLTVTPNDQVVFTDSFCVRVLDENNMVQSTCRGQGNGRGQLNLPLGVAVTKSKQCSIYVSDSSNHRIQKFSHTGAFQIAFGEQGSQPGQFLNPEGITVLSQDKLYVADSGNHRIQVFRQSNNKPCHVFGRFGTKPGEFNTPRDVSLDLPLNRLLVADSGNNRLQAFSLEGTVLPQPGFTENIVRLEYSPCRIVCDPDSFILVSHMLPVVSVLTPRGELVCYLGARKGEILRCLQCSYGICVNSKGEVIISDGSNHSIVVF